MTNELLLRVYPDLLFAYHGHSLLITGRSGQMSDGMHGLYEHDLRILSHYRLLVNGQPPTFDALSAVDPYSTLAYYVSPPAANAPAGEEVDRQVVIRVARFAG